MPHESKVRLCPGEELGNIISKKWAMRVIDAIGNHKKTRFNEIMAYLQKVSPKTLSDRLKELEKAGLIKRQAFAEIPPRVEYSLTQDGKEVMGLLMPLLEWVMGKRRGRTV